MNHARALVADDDPLMLDLVVGVLERLRFEVICAQSGGELLERIAEQGPFDVIVTDVSMPWMTGLQVMHSVRAAGLPCPVVVMTGLSDPDTLAQIPTLGTFAMLLRKPFSLLELHAALAFVTRAGDIPVIDALHRR